MRRLITSDPLPNKSHSCSGQRYSSAGDTEEKLLEKSVAEGIKDIVHQNISVMRLPRHRGHWEEVADPGSGLWVPDPDATFSWAGGKHSMTYKALMNQYHFVENGMRYRHFEPEFEPFEDRILKHVCIKGDFDKRQGKEGTYARALAELERQMRQCILPEAPSTKSEILQYMKRQGLTFHECSDRKTVRVIPEAINAAFPHTGGIGIDRAFRVLATEISKSLGGKAICIQRNCKLSHLKLRRYNVRRIKRRH